MRRIGFASVAAFMLLAIGVLMPPSVSAAPSFKAGFYPATIHGSSALDNEGINTEAGKIECAGAYHAELKEASTTLSLAPTYSSCEGFGFFATVSAEGCKYLLHISAQTAEDKYKASFDISCEAGKSIKVAISTCVVEIPAQSGLGSVALVNDTEASPKKDITFQPNVAGLSYKVTQDGFGCPFAGTGSKTGGSLTASSATTLTGQNPSKAEEKIGVDIGEPTLTAPSFKAGFYPATIHGSVTKGSETITTEGGTVQCATAYHAELKEASTTLELAPTFSECTAFGFNGIPIHSNSCRYLLHVSEQTAEDNFKSTFDIVCPAGKSIVVTGGTCIVEIPAQSGLGSVALVNDTEASPKKDITFQPNVAGLSYKVTQDGFGCPFAGTGSKTGGSLTASSATTLTGQNPSKAEEKIGVEVG
jgi:hypothetical protein